MTDNCNLGYISTSVVSKSRKATVLCLEVLCPVLDSPGQKRTKAGEGDGAHGLQGEVGRGWEVFPVFRRKGSGDTSWLSSFTLWEGAEKMELVVLKICAHR